MLSDEERLDFYLDIGYVTMVADWFAEILPLVPGIDPEKASPLRDGIRFRSARLQKTVKRMQ